MPYECIYTIVDEKDHKSSLRHYLPDETAVADVVGFIEDFAPLLEDVLSGAIIRAGFTRAVDISGLGLRAEPQAGSDVEEGATFIYTDADRNMMRHRVPTFLESLILAGTREVDVSAAAVIALRAAMVTGLTPDATLVPPCEHRGGDLTALSSARETFQRSRS